MLSCSWMHCAPCMTYAGRQNSRNCRHNTTWNSGIDPPADVRSPAHETDPDRPMPIKIAKDLLSTLFCLLAGLAAVLAYRPGLTGGFALDDYTNVVNNTAIAIQHLGWDPLVHAMFSFQAGPAMRPVSMLSFALNAYFTGPTDAMAFKATNLVIHLFDAAWVFMLLSQLLGISPEQQAAGNPGSRYPWLAFVAAAAWLLHPLNVMPVLYVVQRETALSSVFVLLGLNLYVRARQRQLAGKTGALAIWFGVPALTVIAVLCKESG